MTSSLEWINTMKPVFACLLFLASLPACGVVIPYWYDAGILEDRLAVSMPKEQVLKRLGKPDGVVLDDGHQAIWEYRLYPQGDWAAYLIHCPFFPNCYFPAEHGHPYHVVLQDHQLCLWGTPDVVEPLLGIVCGNSARSDRKRLRSGSQFSVVPVFMPPPIVPLPERLAVVSVEPSTDATVNSWLDLTLNFLRTRHQGLVLVEREHLQTILHEIGTQYAGQLDDETTIRLGRLVGADSLLIHRSRFPETSPRSAAFELRLFRVESGTTVFRQMASAGPSPLMPATSTAELYPNLENRVRHLALETAAAYGLAALTAAFGDNPLGLVFDYGWTGAGIRVLDVLQGGPGFRAGLRAGDQLLQCNGEPLRSWMDSLSLPGRLTVNRAGLPLEMTVR